MYLMTQKLGEKMKSPRLTRRELLRVAMLGGTGLVAAACCPTRPQPASPSRPGCARCPRSPCCRPQPAPTAACCARCRQPPQLKKRPPWPNWLKQGKLPPLDKRLPPEPMVITPIEEVGTYGGKLAWIVEGPQFGSYEYQFLYEGPVPLERRCHQG